MKIAYLIVAHDKPAHLSRLIDRLLDDPECGVFVHIDRKSRGQFDTIERDRVIEVKPAIDVYWCDWTQVEAEVLAMRAAIAANHHYDFFVLLSGSDYPLAPATEIRDYFAANERSIFLGSERLPSRTYNKPLQQITWKSDRPQESGITRKRRRLLRKAKLRRGNRNFANRFPDLVPYGGHNWWAMGRSAVEHILWVHDTRRRLRYYFRHVTAPDEVYYHTILENSAYKSRIRLQVTYTDWTAGPPRPGVLTVERHGPLLVDGEQPMNVENPYRVSSRYLFARKFDLESEPLLDLIDAKLGHGPPKRHGVAPRHAGDVTSSAALDAGTMTHEQKTG